MREILFRGKRIDNGEWVYGYYIRANSHWHKYGVHNDWIATDIIQNGGYCNVRGRYAVDPSTVGQFTGLTDKNGNLIFEGDILHLKTNSGGKHYDVVVAERWNCSCCEGVFGFSTEHGDVDVDIRDHNHVQVISNIHDNPELLEVSGDE